MVVDVLHPSRPNVSKAELSEKLAQLYKTEKDRVVTFGFRTAFGGGRSTGFALIYDDEASQKKFEPRYRLVRVSVFYFMLLNCSQLMQTENSQDWRLRWTRPHVNCERSVRTDQRR